MYELIRQDILDQENMRIHERLRLTESIFTNIIFMMQDVNHLHVHVIAPNGKETAHRCTQKTSQITRCSCSIY